MHKSRLAGLIIDCQTDDIESAAAFWSQALGYKIRASAHPEDKGYRLLDTRPDETHLEVQMVSHPSRVHLDIEADDIEAEVQRLEKLGAKRVAPIQTWWVMEAPTGQRFCVVPVVRSDFEANANTWAAPSPERP
jgi:predicted enzyme related to lactoylglutathione lyase